jgi:hypothetical protein
LATFVAVLRYYASHVAFFGGLAGALALFLTGHPTDAIAALIAAVSGLANSTPPAVQVDNIEAAKYLEGCKKK